MKNLKIVAVCALMTVGMSSCYVSTYTVGNGAQTNEEIKSKNNYFLGGLIKGEQADTKSMAGGQTDYTIESKFSFVDYILNSVTFGIYSPRTVVVKK